MRSLALCRVDNHEGLHVAPPSRSLVQLQIHPEILRSSERPRDRETLPSCRCRHSCRSITLRAIGVPCIWRAYGASTDCSEREWQVTRVGCFHATASVGGDSIFKVDLQLLNDAAPVLSWS